MQCTICLETPMRQAQLLPSCGHSFCAPCIEKLPGLCPLCRVKFIAGAAVPNWSLRELNEPIHGPGGKPSAASFSVSQEEEGQLQIVIEASLIPEAPSPPPYPEPPSPALFMSTHLLPMSTQESELLSPQIMSTDLLPAEMLTVATCNANSTDHMKVALQACHQLVSSASLQAQLRHFRRQNCDAFDESNEENALEYTTLHQVAPRSSQSSITRWVGIGDLGVCVSLL